jgi:hypothetical protein
MVINFVELYEKYIYVLKSATKFYITSTLSLERDER